jgi:hypothetical protein
VKPDADGTSAVEAFFGTLKHPLKSEFLRVRRIILGADGGISEAIKWNVPSFRTSEYFATLHLRDLSKIQIVLHLGAKARGKAATGVPDPQFLLEWRGKDRALVTFRTGAELRAKESALGELVRQWISRV